MKGRTEKQIQIESKLETLLNNQPDIIRKYYDSIGNKTFKTKKMYINRVCAFISFLKSEGYDIDNMSVYSDIKTSDLNRYFNMKKYKDGKELSDSYRAMEIYAVKSFFSFLEADEYIDKNPCAKIELPRATMSTDVVYLTPDEVNIIRNNILNGVGTPRAKAIQKKWRERDMALIQLALHTGLRIGALSEINMEDIDFGTDTIRVTEKENITKDVYISGSVKRILLDWISVRKNILAERNKECDALFISTECKRITEVSINEMIKKYTYNIDKKITAHKLRATFATNIYEATEDIYVTSSLLGHSSVETTKRYTNIDKERKIKAVDLIDSI